MCWGPEVVSSHPSPARMWFRQSWVPQAFPAMVNDTWHSFSQHISFIYAHLKLTECLLCTGLPQWLSSKESNNNVGDSGSVPGLGRSSGEGHGNPLRYSCLENPHGQRSLAGYGCKESAHGIAKSRTQLKQLSIHVLCTKPTKGCLFWREDGEVESMTLESGTLSFCPFLAVRP